MSAEILKPRRVAFYGLVGLVGVCAFISVLVLLHAFRPDIDAARHYVSEFANGPRGWLFMTGTAVHGLGNLALAVGLRRSLGRVACSDAAALFFGIAAAGIVVAGIFPIDASGQGSSLAGLVHRLAAAVSFVVELIALFLFSTAFAANPLWRHRARLSFAWATITAVMLAALALAVLVNRLPGLAERLTLTSFLMWEAGALLGLIGAGSKHTS